MDNPGSVRSDRIGNTPDAVNNAILTKGWLRVKNKDFSFVWPKQKDEQDEFPTDTMRLNDLNTSQTPIDMNCKYAGLMCAHDGFLINPIFKEGNNEATPCQTCLYFRVTGLSIYFTQAKEDMTVIGQMAVKNIRNIKESTDVGPSCLLVETVYTSWTLCGASQAEKQEWYCSIK